MHLAFPLVEVMHPCGITMREVIDAAAHGAEKFLIAALQRPELRRKAEMPLANERGRIPGVGEQRRQRRMPRRQAEDVAAAAAARDRLIRAAAQAILPAPGRE